MFTRLLLLLSCLCLIGCTTLEDMASPGTEAPAVDTADSEAPETGNGEAVAVGDGAESLADAATDAASGSAQTSRTDETGPDAAPARQGDFASLLDASHLFASTASRYRQAAMLSKDSDFVTLLTELAETRQALADRTSGAAAYYEAEDDLAPSNRPAAPYIGAEAQQGAEALGRALYDSETALIERLRGYLADTRVSIDAKTYFQEILPTLRADRERVAALAGIEEGEAAAAEDDETGAAGDAPEDERTGT